MPATFHPSTSRDWAAVHESAHVIVARRLGCHVSAVCLFREGDGYAIAGHPKDAAGVFAGAVMTAAGVVVDRLANQAPERSARDREQVEALHQQYRELTGADFPSDPYAKARAVLNEPGASDDLFRLAQFLTPGRVLTAEDIACILGPA